MTQETIIEMLQAYRLNVSKCGLLRIEIDEAETKLKTMQRTMAEEAATSSGNGAAGMPRSTKISNPTERIGLMLASGEVPQHITDLKRSIEELKRELYQRTIHVNRVDAWLAVLTERERWVVTGHIMDCLTWNDMSKDYEHRYGQPRTRRSLQRLKRQALRQIARIDR